MYLRFVCDKRLDGMNGQAGFFVAAYDLEEEGLLDQHSQAYLKGLLSWFGDNLPEPSEFSRSLRSEVEFKRGLSWFKPAAKRHLDKAFEMKAFLELHDYHITVLKSYRIGYVIYEDEVQVVADPFSDTPVA